MGSSPRSRRRPRLQAAHREADAAQRLGEFARRRLARAARRPPLVADVHQTVQERAGRDHHRAAADGVAVFERQTGDASVLGEHPAGTPEEPRDVRLGRERVAHPGAIPALVGLRARRPHGGAAAPVEQPELDARGVDGEAHEPTERVDLPDQMPFCRAADRGIARHQRDRLGRERDEPDAAPEPRRRPGRFTAGVASADDHHVELKFACHVDLGCEFISPHRTSKKYARAGRRATAGR
jgi:hypothetical protein